MIEIFQLRKYLDSSPNDLPLGFKQRLAARAYLGTVIDDLTQALGEDEGSHVAHRRH